MKRLSAEKIPEMVFLVVQNIDYLYGEYFSRAVVIAFSEEQAISKAEDRIKQWNEDSANVRSPVTFDRSRVKAVKLGPLVQRPSGGGLGTNQQFLHTEDVLTIDIGEDYDL